MKKRLVILLVSPPGDLQIGLQALFKAHLDADILAVGDVSSVLNVIDKQKPDLVILDQDAQKDNPQMLVKEVTTRWQEIHLIILVNDDEGQDLFLGTGAELIITKGLPGLKLVDKIKKFLIEERE